MAVHRDGPDAGPLEELLEVAQGLGGLASWDVLEAELAALEAAS